MRLLQDHIWNLTKCCQRQLHNRKAHKWRNENSKVTAMLNHVPSRTDTKVQRSTKLVACGNVRCRRFWQESLEYMGHVKFKYWRTRNDD